MCVAATRWNQPDHLTLFYSRLFLWRTYVITGIIVSSLLQSNAKSIYMYIFEKKQAHTPTDTGGTWEESWFKATHLWVPRDLAEILEVLFTATGARAHGFFLEVGLARQLGTEAAIQGGVDVPNLHVTVEPWARVVRSRQSCWDFVLHFLANERAQVEKRGKWAAWLVVVSYSDVCVILQGVSYVNMSVPYLNVCVIFRCFVIFQNACATLRCVCVILRCLCHISICVCHTPMCVCHTPVSVQYSNVCV